MHLKDHNEMGYLQQGIDYLKEHNVEVDLSTIEGKKEFKLACGWLPTAPPLPMEIFMVHCFEDVSW